MGHGQNAGAGGEAILVFTILIYSKVCTCTLQICGDDLPTAGPLKS